MDSIRAIVPDRAPAASTATSTSALEGVFLQYHLGAVVGAVAGVIGEGVTECRDGGLIPETKVQAAKFLCELVRLREFMIGDFPDFDRIAKERGVEVLVACDTPPATAKFLVGETMNLLAKLVINQSN